MVAKPYFMRVSSQKGGVGKTVISVNLAVALSMLKHKVLLADTDFQNPAVAAHLRLDDISVGVDDVLSGKVKLDKAVVKYFPSGMDVLPGIISAKEFDAESITRSHIDRVADPLRKSNHEFVIFDTSPGISAEYVLLDYNEVLLITTPDLPSLSSLLKLQSIYHKHGLKTSFVVNRVANRQHEISVQEIEKILMQKAVAVLPEDPNVPDSIENQIPLYVNDVNSPFSHGIAELAKHFTKRFRF